MEEQYFKPAIAANYFNPNRFRWELNERQVSDTSLDLSSPRVCLGLSDCLCPIESAVCWHCQHLVP